jgi:hypothetical protein
MPWQTAESLKEYGTTHIYEDEAKTGCYKSLTWAGEKI